MQKYKKNAITFLAFEHSTLNQRKTLVQALRTCAKDKNSVSDWRLSLNL